MKKQMTEKLKHKIPKTNNGITLIALVITIIVMLILVAVTISMAINGGLFQKAGAAVGETQNAINKEQVLANGRIQVDGVWYDSIDAYIAKTPSLNQNGEEDNEIKWKQLVVSEMLPEIQTWAALAQTKTSVLGLDVKGDIYEYTSFVDDISARFKELIKNNGKVTDVCYSVYIMENGKAYYYNYDNDEFICINEEIEELENEKIVYVSPGILITDGGRALAEVGWIDTIYPALMDKKILNVGSYILSETDDGEQTEVLMMVLDDQKAYYLDEEGNFVCFSNLHEELKNKKIVSSNIYGEACFITDDGMAYGCYCGDVICCYNDNFDGLKDKKIVKITSDGEFILDNGELMYFGDEDFISLNSEIEELKDKKIMVSDGDFGLLWLEDGVSYYSFDEDNIINLKGYKEILTGKNIKQISCGYSYIVALDNEGKVWSWGLNGDGQLGDGTNSNSNEPICISEIEDYPLNNIEITQVAAGNSHTVAVDSEGKVWSWGYNYDGQLGDGTNSNSNEPICISEIEDHPLNDILITHISAAVYHAVAVDSEGKVWSWGDNLSGQLGDGTNSNSNEPICISEIEDHPLNNIEITQVAVENSYTVAVDSEGKVWSWGGNLSGQLGDGTNSNSNEPICISEIEEYPLNNIEIKEVVVGHSYTVAIDNEGKVWSWGSNSRGQLGDGTNSNSSEPICISNINNSLQEKNIVSVHANNYITVLLDNNNNVYIFGSP